MMEILTYAVMGLVAVFIFDYLILRNKVNETLKVVSELAIQLCEIRGIPREYSADLIKRDHSYLLEYCKGAIKAIRTGPKLHWIGISDRQMEALGMQEIISLLADGIEEEYKSKKQESDR